VNEKLQFEKCFTEPGLDMRLESKVLLQVVDVGDLESFLFWTDVLFRPKNTIVFTVDEITKQKQKIVRWCFFLYTLSTDSIEGRVIDKVKVGHLASQGESRRVK
jgi:hypothetical protein